MSRHVGDKVNLRLDHELKAILLEFLAVNGGTASAAIRVLAKLGSIQAGSLSDSGLYSIAYKEGIRETTTAFKRCVGAAESESMRALAEYLAEREK